MSQLINRSRCPHCEKKGQDQSGDNLANYSDGHSHCYACGYYNPGNIYKALHHKLSPPTTVTNSHVISLPNLSNPPFTHKLPVVARNWLSSYGITDSEIHQHNFVWDPIKELLIMPIYDGDRLISYQGRYFGSNPKYPKYHTKGTTSNFFKLFPQSTTSMFVLVEDYLSALRVGRTYNAIPLFGSVVPLKLILSLVYQRPILRIWLDRDKATEAIGYANAARQYIPNCGTIITDLDPKVYNDETIREFVDGSVLCNNQVFPRLPDLPEIQ